MAVTDLEQLHVAVIEDSDDDFDLLDRVLAPRVASVHRFATGEAALAALTAVGEPLCARLVLVVDLHLPGIDGTDVIRAARSLPGGEAPTMCMLTSSVHPRDHTRALDAGADVFMAKPGTLRELRTIPDHVGRAVGARGGSL